MTNRTEMGNIRLLSGIFGRNAKKFVAFVAEYPKIYCGRTEKQRPETKSPLFRKRGIAIPGLFHRLISIPPATNRRS